MTRDQLDYVAKIKEGSRRIRELRDELGWPIESHIDVSFLQPGQYRLVSADPADRRDKRQRLYPEGLRARIFERDNFTCQQCQRNREHAAASGDSRFYLEIHHRNAVADQLDGLPTEELNKPSNLVTSVMVAICARRPNFSASVGEIGVAVRRNAYIPTNRVPPTSP